MARTSKARTANTLYAVTKMIIGILLVGTFCKTSKLVISVILMSRNTKSGKEVLKAVMVSLPLLASRMVIGKSHSFKNLTIRFLAKASSSATRIFILFNLDSNRYEFQLFCGIFNWRSM